MKISVITVCYNASKTITLALRSVQNQTYNNIEHIIIDGCSTDNTLEIVETEGKHVSRIISEKDQGIYDAMNKGVLVATGDVIAFLNSDDFYKHHNVLANIASIMQAENLDALYGDVEFFDPAHPDSVVRIYNSSHFKPDRLGWGWMPAHPALFVRRSIFEQYGLFQTDYRIAGDFEFIVRIFKNNLLRHRHLAEILVRMQIGGISTSGFRATFKLNQEMIRACRANNISTNWLQIILRYPFKALEFFGYRFRLKS